LSARAIESRHGALARPLIHSPLIARLVIVGAACALALTMWLWPASIHIVAWPPDGPRRIAVFSPFMRLAWLGAALGAGLLVAFSTNTPAGLRSRMRILAPLLLLLLVAVSYLPWLPDRVPLLLIFAGPVRWIVVAFAAFVMAGRIAQQYGSPTLQWPRVTARAVFVVSLTVYALFGMRSLATIGLKGDEPHYLLITQSLLRDGDLRIENNHRNRDYRVFSREELPPDYLQRGKDGAIYSIHAPGLPAVLLPAFAMAHQYGAVLMLCVFGALAAAGVFELASMAARPPIALATCVAIALTVPFVPYAWQVFPEMAGAAIVAWAAVWLVRTEIKPAASWFARGVCVALLPWFHTKFIILLAGLAALFGWQLRKQMGAVAALLAPIAVSLLAWFAFFYTIYGTSDPQAPYGTYARDWVKLAFVPRGVLGLLFDQKFGLVVYAPVYLLVPVGAWLALRPNPWRWRVVAATLLASAYIVSTARLYMWWGGWSAPARFLVPVLPLAAVPLAVALEWARATRGRAIVWTLLASSLTIALVSAAVPGQLLLFSDAHGISRLAASIQGSAPLTATLPTFTENEWRPQSLIPRGYDARTRQEIAVRGRLTLLDRFQATGRQPFDYAQRRALTREEWLRVGSLTADLDRSSAEHPPVPAVVTERVATGVVVAYIDDHTYPEGGVFWTKGTERGTVLVNPGGNSQLVLVVHAGPDGALVLLRVNGLPTEMRLTVNETREIELDIPAAVLWVPISVQSSTAFRPADVDPQTADQRLLGCQVRVLVR